MNYILMCATPSRGMITKGSIQLIEHDHKAVVDHQIKNILKVDKNADITFVLGFEHDKIQKYILKNNYNVRTIINQNYKITSQTDSLRMGINSCLSDATFIIHGDIIFSPEAITESISERSSVLKALKQEKSKVGILCNDKNSKMLKMSFGLPDTWSQIFFLNKTDFDKSKTVINSLKKNKLTYEFINLLNKEINFNVVNPIQAKTMEITKKYEDLSDYG